MGEVLRQRLQQARFPGPAEEAFLNLMVASAFLREQVDHAASEAGITAAQYNVLRILRGAYPDGHPRCEIIKRMIERAPDVTRLIDRLEARGLAERDRSGKDRRLSMTRITDKGLRLVRDLEPRMEQIQQEFAARISRQDCRELSRICEAIYAEREP